MPYAMPSLTVVRPCIKLGRFKLYVSDRLMEWFCALLMIGDAIVLSIPGVSMSGAFGKLAAQGFSAASFAAFFAAFGTLRAFALLANGNIPVYGPRARAISALCACPVWAVLGMAQAQDALAGHISLALPTYFCLALAESASAIRATYDVGRI